MATTTVRSKAKPKGRAKPKGKEKGEARAATKPKARAKPKAASSRARAGRKAAVLLAGGNPQIAKGDGDAPVAAFVAASPGWKRAFGERLDALVVRAAPGVKKAVRWNSPMYGMEGRGYFLSFHLLTRYVKITFFAGTSLRPVPPGGTVRSKQVRWLDVREDDVLDEAQLTRWVKQATALPGWTP